MPRRAVVFGAGSVGRGFIGQLLCEAGWPVTFLDVALEVVEALAADHSYPHLTVSNAGVERRVIGPVTALDARDTEAAVAALVAADLAVTCVGARVLPAVADTLAMAIRARLAAGRGPLDVLLAENLHDASTVMRGLLTERLPGLPEGVLAAHVGLLETSIGRMIPVSDPSVTGAEPTLVIVEPYRFLPYDDAARRGPQLEVPGLVANSAIPFDFYGDRKLYVHNLGHCFTAYLGRLVGAEFIWQAIGDPAIRYLVRAAMVESSAALTTAYGVALAELLAHIDDLLHRFGNRALGDTVDRVGRDPLRKLAAGDRLLGALELAASHNLPGHHLSLAVAAGLEELQRQQAWDDTQVWAHLEAGLAHEVLAPRRDLLAAQRAALADGFDFANQLALIEQAYEPSHVL